MSNTLKKTAELSTEEKRALLARLLREKAAGRAKETLTHRLFEGHAARTPDAIALVTDSGSLSYQQLNAKANQLAQHLIRLGANQDSLIGISIDRSHDLIVALLAVLKTGAAYVPIDPLYPHERVAYMIDDARIPLLITHSDILKLLGDIEALPVCIDTDAEKIQKLPDTNINSSPNPKNLAYVIYTSGSTGKPKGVQVTHEALANFIASFQQILNFQAQDALLAVTTLSFDIAALEIFLPLATGAKVLLATRDVAADGNLLAQKIQDTKPSFMQATPATWRLLLEAGWQGDNQLNILCGGEALPRELAQRLSPRAASLWNLYGPTETTIWSTAAKVDDEDGPVNIGKPIANTQIYILDAHLRPVPIGVVGELYIGGTGLARGYLERPALTAERFLPDPVGNTPGARIYRTGDLARWRADGKLECLGRIDHQVKIRGFRIELGEVEAALLKHPGVREAVAVAREDSTGENRLVAYVVPRNGDENTPTLAVADLRRSLQESLPEAMVPSVFVLLEALPLTPNGKIDRKALPDPDQASVLTAAFVAPRGPIEEALAGVWSEILGRDRIGVHDSFFDLGGHSLLAARLLAKLRDMFGVELPLKALFDVPTVAGQAHRLEDALREGSGVQAPPLRPVSRDGDVIASFAQQRLWFLDQLQPGSPLYNIPLNLHLTGELDVAALERVFNELVRRHESLRTTFRSEGGRPLQVIAPSQSLSLPIVDLSGLPEAERQAEVSRRADEEAKSPFDLAKGPLVRVSLLRLTDRDHVLLLNMHHIISDGWSLGVLVYEAGVLYEAFSQNRPSPLPELPVQYADFAVWQREWLQGQVLEDQLTYWKEQLGGVRTLELTTDRPRPSTLTHRGGERTKLLPKDLMTELRALGKQESATLFMTLMAAFQTLLNRYSGQEDFAIGTPIAGRTHSETEELIGFFVNTLVVRGNLAGNPPFRELLKRVKQTSLGAFAHQDLPFDQLVSALQTERDTSRTPLFQVMMVLQNAPLPTLSTSNLTMTPVDALSGTSKFDLTLLLSEEAEGLKASFEYNADLFDEATIDRMLAHYQTLLESIVANPDQTIAALPMLSEAERRQLLGQWDDPLADDDLQNLDDLSDEDLDSLINNLSSEEDANDE